MNVDRSDARKSSRREFSAGGVVYRKTGAGIEILLIRPSRKNDKEKWTFPKGWIGDHGPETTEAAALREVREEGGVEARTLGDLGDISYAFTWEGQLIHKTVHYYLMEYIAGDPEDHDQEVAEARFVPIGDVEDMLAYKNDQEFFRNAKRKVV